MKFKLNTVLERKTVVLKACIVGFYTSKDRPSNTCTHVYCGYRSNAYDCNMAYYFYLFQPQYQNYSSGAIDKVDLQKHYDAKCRSNWCHVKHGPSREPGKIVCKRNYYKRYTDIELANPNIKPEIIAIGIDYASHNIGNVYNAVALYNLEKDCWHNEDWWQQTTSGMLMPPSSNHGIKIVDIFGINDVVASMKANL